MEPRDWFNLRQLYRQSRCSSTQGMESKVGLKRCNQGVRMWCGRTGGVVVTVGVALVVLGLTQLVAGTYFMLALPIFQLGSNIWTGSWSGLCGLLVASIGWRRQTMRRGQVVLVATLSVMVADVANIVILQVGENGVFLDSKDKQIIVENNQEYTVLVASWLTTIIAAVGVVISFFGAQYLFCAVVRGPRVKGRMPVTRSLSEEDLQLRQVQTTRFQPPSLAVTAPSEIVASTSVDGGGGAAVAVHGLNGGSASGGGGDGGGSKDGSSNGGGGGVSGGASSKPPQGKRKKSRRESTQATKATDNGVPYFLRNHQSAWQYILPEATGDVVVASAPSEAEPPPEAFSRSSTLSRTSKSSFQPYRPANIDGENGRPGLSPENGRPGGLTPDSQPPRSSRPPSSCSTSLYSIPETGSEPSHLRKSTRTLTRPSVPPPPPPPFSSSSLRGLTAGGWESCAVMQYPGQSGGGGFVIDLD